MRRRLEQTVDVGIGAEQRGAIAGREPCRPMDPVTGERLEVVTPRDCHSDVAYGVLKDEIPSDDPGDDLSERRVRVRVRAAGLRNHGRELGVAKASKGTGRAEQYEGDDERRTRSEANDLAVRPDLPRRRRTDRPENPST